MSDTLSDELEEPLLEPKPAKAKDSKKPAKPSYPEGRRFTMAWAVALHQEEGAPAPTRAEDLAKVKKLLETSSPEDLQAAGLIILRHAKPGQREIKREVLLMKEQALAQQLTLARVSGSSTTPEMRRLYVELAMQLLQSAPAGDAGLEERLRWEGAMYVAGGTLMQDRHIEHLLNQARDEEAPTSHALAVISEYALGRHLKGLSEIILKTSSYRDGTWRTPEGLPPHVRRGIGMEILARHRVPAAEIENRFAATQKMGRLHDARATALMLQNLRMETAAVLGRKLAKEMGYVPAHMF